MDLFLQTFDRLRTLVSEILPAEDQKKEFLLEEDIDVDNDGMADLLWIENYQGYARIQAGLSRQPTTVATFIVPRGDPVELPQVSYEESSGRLTLSPGFSFQVYGERDEVQDILRIGRTMASCLPSWTLPIFSPKICSREPPLEIVYGGIEDLRRYFQELREKGIDVEEKTVEFAENFAKRFSGVHFMDGTFQLIFLRERPIYWLSLAGWTNLEASVCHELAHSIDHLHPFRPRQMSIIQWFQEKCPGVSFFMQKVEEEMAFPTSYVEKTYQDRRPLGGVEYFADMNSLWRNLGGWGLNSHPGRDPYYFRFLDFLMNSRGDPDFIATLCRHSAEILGVEEEMNR